METLPLNGEVIDTGSTFPVTGGKNASNVNSKWSCLFIWLQKREGPAVGCWPEGVLMGRTAKHKKYSSKCWMKKSTGMCCSMYQVTICQGQYVLTKQAYKVAPKALGSYFSPIIFLSPPRMEGHSSCYYSPWYRRLPSTGRGRGNATLRVCPCDALLRLSWSTKRTNLGMSIKDSNSHGFAAWTYLSWRAIECLSLEAPMVQDW